MREVRQRGQKEREREIEKLRKKVGEIKKEREREIKK